MTNLPSLQRTKKLTTYFPEDIRGEYKYEDGRNICSEGRLCILTSNREGIVYEIISENIPK